MALPPIKSGLVETVQQVRTYLADHQVTASVVFGWKERARKNNNGPTATAGGNRVVIIPSDPLGKSGKIDRATSPGPRNVRDGNGVVVGHVRSLFEWHRTFTVVVWASSSADSEELVVEKTETLFEWVLRAFHAAAGHQITWGEPGWTVDPKELTNGRELVVQGTLNTPMFDVPTETTRPALHMPRGTFGQPE